MESESEDAIRCSEFMKSVGIPHAAWFRSSRDAVEESGSVAAFLEKNTTTLRTLIITSGSGFSPYCYEPLMQKEAIWGRDALVLFWNKFEAIINEEEKERLMEAIGSLCRTSLLELHLMLMTISPKLLNRLFQAMHHKSSSLQCLRLQLLRCSDPAGNSPVYASLPSSLLILEFINDKHFEVPIKFDAAPPPATSTSSKYGATAEAGEAARSSDSTSPLSSLLGCTPHLQCLGISWPMFVQSKDNLRNAANVLSDKKSLKAFRLWSTCGNYELPEEFGTQMLRHNTTLTGLALKEFNMSQECYDKFWEGVAANQTLTFLSMKTCEGPWTVESVVDSLEDNGSLHYIQLNDTPLNSYEAIEAQAERNKRNVEMMKSLGVSPHKVRPTSARVFLCGEPFAGKTTIVRSLAKSFNATSKLKCLDKDSLLYKTLGKERPRTKGIEVTSIRAEDGLKISFWDLAGQEEYRCFHDYAFPDLSSRASPSSFLIVWSPIVNSNSQPNIQLKAGEDFERELNYWLKFIVSKTRKSKKYIPNVIIAITRKDQLPRTIDNLTTEIMNTQRKFEGFVEFGMDGVFEVDARDPSSLRELKKKIVTTSNANLASVKPVFELQEMVRKHFDQKLARNMLPPIVPKEDYLKICKEDLRIDSEEMLESAALLLSASGDFMYKKEDENIIVDMQWFCHTVMGELIYSTGPSDAVMHDKKTRGLFEREYLQKILSEQLQNPRLLATSGGIRGFFGHCCKRHIEPSDPAVGGDALLQLLMDLQMVCEDPKSSKIYMPSNLEGGQDEFIGSMFPQGFQLGRRLRCEDSTHTFLTPGVFPSLQVAFLNKFTDRVALEKGLICINDTSGVHVLIQLYAHGGHEHCIDILVGCQSCTDDNVEWIKKNMLMSQRIDWIKKYVILDVIKLCALDKGIQGVHLVEEVIGPLCEAGTLKHDMRQAILLPELQAQLGKDWITRYQCDINDATYSWPFHGGIRKPEVNKYVDLLSVMEIQEVGQRYGRILEEARTMTKD